MRLVLDTSVLVAAIRSPTGASKALLQAALDRRVDILLSTALLLEYEAVMTREEHLEVAEMSTDEISSLLDALCDAAIKVKPSWKWRPQLNDPDDEMVLEAAANGKADALVTFNRSDFVFAASRFGIKVLSPSQALELVVMS